MPIAPQPQLKAGLFGTSPGPRTLRPVTIGKPPAPKPPGGVTISHRIGVQAPADVIWSVIADLSGWSAWNPTYPQAAGDIRIGGALRLTLTLPGQAPTTIAPTVIDWTPDDQLHWKTTLLGGMIRSIHFIEIEALAEAGCIVSNGEIVGGLMGRSLARRSGRTMYRGFVAMNEALKIQAEARFQAAGR